MMIKKIQEEMFKTMNRFGKMRYEIFFHDLSKREFEMLVVISRYMEENEAAKGIFVSKLAAILQVSPPAVSRMIGGLEEKGYIIRDSDQNDRRNTYICLTEYGLKHQKEAERRMFRLMERIARRMGEKEISELIYLWNRMADIMEEELEGDRHV